MGGARGWQSIKLLSVLARFFGINTIMNKKRFLKRGQKNKIRAPHPHILWGFSLWLVCEMSRFCLLHNSDIWHWTRWHHFSQLPFFPLLRPHLYSFLSQTHPCHSFSSHTEAGRNKHTWDDFRRVCVCDIKYAHLLSLSNAALIFFPVSLVFPQSCSLVTPMCACYGTTHTHTIVCICSPGP